MNAEITPEPPDAEQSNRVGIGRVWSLRTVAAAAITAVALSGAAGAGLAAASDGGSASGPGGRGGFGPRGQLAGQNGPMPAPGQAPGGQPLQPPQPNDPRT